MTDKPNRPTSSPQDLERAQGLRAAIEALLGGATLAPVLPSKLPRWDGGAKLFRAPGGAALLEVSLEKATLRSAVARSAFVDPKSNQLWVVRTGGFAGSRQGSGPLALPESAKFTGSSYPVAEILQLAKVANAQAKG